MFERSSKGELKYVGEKRNRLTIEGYITNKYVYKDSVVLHIVENGRIRDTSAIFKLVVKSNELMVGSFFTTAANSLGKVSWERGIGELSFNS